MTRQELHQLVWSRPVMYVADQLGVSGSYLARVCSVLNVPRPERGYWAKQAVGVTSPITPLPEAETGHPLEWSKQGGFGPSTADLPKDRQQGFKKFPRLNTKVVVPDTHHLIAGARAHFEASRPNDSLLHKYGEQYLRPYKKVLVDLTVTKSALVKGLALTNALFNALEAVGYHVVIPNSRALQRCEADLRETPNARPQDISHARWKPRDPTVVYAEGAVIGIAVVEMSEEVMLRYMGSGKYIRESEYRPPTRRLSTDQTWTTTQDVPAGRFRVMVYSPYQRVTWSTHWQDSKGSSLHDQIPAITQAMTDIAAELTKRKEAADAEHEREIRLWKAQEERRQRLEDKREIEAARKASVLGLEEVIEAWSTALNREAFFKRVEERAAELPESKQQQIRERLALARTLADAQDPIEHLLFWKTPSEIYTPRYAHEESSDSEE